MEAGNWTCQLSVTDDSGETVQSQAVTVVVSANSPGFIPPTMSTDIDDDAISSSWDCDDDNPYLGAQAEDHDCDGIWDCDDNDIDVQDGDRRQCPAESCAEILLNQSDPTDGNYWILNSDEDAVQVYCVMGAGD